MIKIRLFLSVSVVRRKISKSILPLCGVELDQKI